MNHNKKLGREIKNSQKGQVMLFSVLVISAVFLSVTVIAGLLVVNQLSQVTRSIDSASAIYAADAAVERGLFYANRCINDVKPTGWPEDIKEFCDQIGNQEPDTNGGFPPLFLNGATYKLSIVLGESVKATGRSGRTARAFEARF
ncbi:MAG: hypothetical protein AAB407_00360 [Patescibacteria group bacterium]